MTEVIRVLFRHGGRSVLYDPDGFHFSMGDYVVVETPKGIDLGRCLSGNHMIDDNAVVKPLNKVMRPATDRDVRVDEDNLRLEEEAFGIAEEKIAKHGLEMKLVGVECAFEGNKIIFYFTADGRVDFRELVKDLAGVFRTRIELRQIGVRDEARLQGGLGICGQPYCCSRFLNEFQPVSTKMAKTQNLSLNPSKISGCCGRLMCCLRYEQEAYEDLIQRLPKAGCYVETEEGYGNVVGVELIRQRVKVKLDSSTDATVSDFEAEDVAEVPGGRPPEGEQPPHVLQPREKKHKGEAEQEDPWTMPRLFSFDTEEEPPRADAEDKSGKEHRRNRNARYGDKYGDRKPQNKKPRSQSEKKSAEPRPTPKAETPAKAEGEKKPNSNYRRRFRPRGKK